MSITLQCLNTKKINSNLENFHMELKYMWIINVMWFGKRVTKQKDWSCREDKKEKMGKLNIKEIL